MSQWEVVNGLETHAQLPTQSKIFSGASTAFGAAPNRQACAVDIALPGVLPVLNREAVVCAIKFGLAIGARIAPRSVFARKNYFYPDLPKGYQISQYELPVVGRGTVEIVLEDGSELRSHHVVLALGHSARDTFRMLHRRGVQMEAKPFSLGFRIEHPQSMIDKARLGPFAGHPALGAADYKLVHHASNGRTVYSFCMCPGGTVVAATSEPGRVVTNGMSQYSRNERNANAGIVVGISPEEDFPGGPLAGIELQERLEALAFELGGGDYCAPAQCVGDFLRGVPSTGLGEVQPSYTPGVKLGDLSGLLPPALVEAIREALPAFGRQIRGFDRDDAVLTGIESRTSSPLRIPRDKDSLQGVNLRGLYPGGEGAGYAGGILSAGVDGIRIAEQVALSMLEDAGLASAAEPVP